MSAVSLLVSQSFGDFLAQVRLTRTADQDVGWVPAFPIGTLTAAVVEEKRFWKVGRQFLLFLLLFKIVLFFKILVNFIDISVAANFCEKYAIYVCLRPILHFFQMNLFLLTLGSEVQKAPQACSLYLAVTLAVILKFLGKGFFHFHRLKSANVPVTSVIFM